MARAKKKTSTVKVGNLSKVQTATVLTKGWAKARIVSGEIGEGDKGEYIKWTFEITDGKNKSKQPKQFYTSLAENALFNLKSLLEAVGYKIPKKGFDLDPSDVIDEELYIYIDHEVYENRTQNVVTQLADELPDDEDEDNEDEDNEDEDSDEDDDEDDDDEDDDLTADDINEMSEQELKDAVEEHELDVSLKKFKTLPAKRKAVLKAAKSEGLV